MILWTNSDAAKYFGVDPCLIRHWAYKGHVCPTPVYKKGRRLKFDRDEFLALHAAWCASRAGKTGRKPTRPKADKPV